MIRKSATLTSVFFSVILVLMFFIGMYAWFSWNVSDSRVSVDSKYNATQTEILAQQSKLDKTIGDIRTAINSVIEPESFIQTAMNGLKGLRAIIVMPIQIIDIAGSTYFAIGNLIDLPSWVKIIVIMSITILIVLIIVGLLKGEQKT